MFAEKILSGEKRFEFRRSIYADMDVKVALIYSTSPVKRIVGEFDINEVIFGPPEALWEKTHHSAGIDYLYYSEYFKGRKTAFALVVGNVKRYEIPIDPSVSIFNFTPPQSFMYYPRKSNCVNKREKAQNFKFDF
ncbi:hypothetical protein [Methylobacterium sp. 10]|uniref:hypothetical protein n=1 Tax=Methylobacterium sp. 10 TaxID=1101191 RepID=UPI0018CC2219|nr:hypothetical protein [Methylobacterium sp. 10]